MIVPGFTKLEETSICNIKVQAKSISRQSNCPNFCFHRQQKVFARLFSNGGWTLRSAKHNPSQIWIAAAFATFFLPHVLVEFFTLGFIWIVGDCLHFQVDLACWHVGCTTSLNSHLNSYKWPEH